MGERELGVGVRLDQSNDSDRQTSIGDLVEYVEEQRPIERHRADRNDRRRSANVLQRARWLVTNEPSPGTELTE
jgi:hypothetical protein